MLAKLRVMCWNIGEGDGASDGRLPKDSMLENIANQIRSLSPDVVLLNEAMDWDLLFGSGTNQVVRLSDMTGLPYRHWGHTARLGLAGHKVVAILSRYPLGSPTVHPLPSGYAFLQTSFWANNVYHYIFSTRFNHDSKQEILQGLQQARDLVRDLNPLTAVIFGGDFNANEHSPEVIDFSANSNLQDVYVEHPDPDSCDPNNRIDFIFYRGPYHVTSMQQRCPSTDPPMSDHPWVFAEFEASFTNIGDGLFLKGDGPAIYRIDRGQRRWVASGDQVPWNDVVTIDDNILNEIPEGPMWPLPDGAFVKGSGPGVYRIEGGQRHWVHDPSQVSWNRVITLPDNALDAIPQGADVRPGSGTTTSGTHQSQAGQGIDDRNVRKGNR